MSSAKIIAAPEKLTFEERPPLSNPWPWMIAALTACGLAFLMGRILGESSESVRVVLVFVGIIAALAAIAVRPTSSLVLLGVALTAFLGSWALFVLSQGEHASSTSAPILRRTLRVFGFLEWQPEAWNSIRWFLAIGALVAAVAGGVVALPHLWRRVVMSLVILLHFAGIVTVVLAAPPGPWLAQMVWEKVYRPYVQFMYLINAYHFYAPNPGPSYYFKFRVAYTKEGDEKNTYWQWIKVPDVDDEDGWPNYPLALQYQRRLSLVTLVAAPPQVPAADVANEMSRRHESANLERYKANMPIFPNIPGKGGFLMPNPGANSIVPSYIRHVASDFQRKHPDVTITGIKLYRLEHFFLGAQQLASGDDPLGYESYNAIFWGDFDTKGNLKDPNDPYLYTLMPFIRVNPQQPALFTSNVDIIRPLAFDLKKYLLEYLKDEESKVPRLPAELAADTSLEKDFNALFAQPRVSASQRAAFEKKFPILAGRTERLLETCRTDREMFADIGGRLKAENRLEDDAKLTVLLVHLNFLLRKYPNLVAELMQLEAVRDEGGVERYLRLAQIVKIWELGRFRMPRAEEDQFDIAVATATHLNGDPPVFLNYMFYHAGDPKWVRYPDEKTWQKLRPLDVVGGK